MVFTITADNIKFNICFTNIDDIGDDTVKYYWPLIPDKKRTEIANLLTSEERRIALAYEVTARQALAGFNGTAEERVRLNYTADGRIVSDNKSEYLITKKTGKIVCVAVCSAPAGLGLCVVSSFDFASAQSNLSDSEIRSLMAVSGCSLMDMVNSSKCSKPAATEFYAKLCALKAARNECFAEKQKKPQASVVFNYVSGEFFSKTDDCYVVYCGSDKKNNFAAALVGKNE